MADWVVFLRAINLGRTRKFPKADIVAATEAAGGTAVATHLNTGNVFLHHPARSRAGLEQKLEAAYVDATGFAVPAIGFTTTEFKALAAEAAQITRPDLERHYIYLLKSEPDPACVDQLAELSGGHVVVVGRAAHVLFGPGSYTSGTVDPYQVEKRLGVVATNRNLAVVSTLADRWC
ncbi:hypothetical protein BH09ACT11_BH09ACT11_15640 [soil metagenome]